MTILERLNRRYLRQLFITPEGRAHVLAQAADGEASGESAIFDRLLARVDDLDLQRVIAKHRQDELRHERMFRERLAAQGARWELPEELRLVPPHAPGAGGGGGPPPPPPPHARAAHPFLPPPRGRRACSFR